MLLAFFLPATASGTESRLDAEHEINHLLAFVEHSGCTFIRNDAEYGGERARKHLEIKHNYTKKRS